MSVTNVIERNINPRLHKVYISLNLHLSLTRHRKKKVWVKLKQRKKIQVK